MYDTNHAFVMLRGGTVVDAGAVRAIREPNAA